MSIKKTPLKRTISSKIVNESVKPTVKKINKVINTNSSAAKKIKKVNKLVETMEFKLINKSKKLTNLTRTHINGMLKSGVFTNEERKAVAVLINKSKVYTLNENTAKILDGNVSIIMESNYTDKILTEGFFGDIWDGLKGLGDKAKDALKSGWSKVKGIWSEFTDLIKELVDYVKEALSTLLQKVSDFAKGKAKELKSKVEEKFKKLEKGAIKKEVGELKETYEFLTKKGETLSEGEGWADKTIKGDFNAEDLKLDDKTIEIGEKELEKIADSLIHKRNGLKLIEEKKSLLSDKEVLNALLESRAKRFLLSESGGFSHLKDSVKNPVLKKIVHYGMLGVGYLINPIGNAIKTIIEKAGPKLLPKLSEGVKKIGGPGIFVFAALSGLLAETIEVIYEVNHSYLAGGELIKSALTIITGGVSEAATSIIEGIAYTLIAIGVGTIIYNLIVGLIDSNPDAAH
jgi:ElaB/YqjD/DUF883 family membrane-anchored ribosome-binding protein